MSNSLDKLIQRLKPHLKDYLLSQGIEIRSNNMCCCFNPNHDDRNPSCSISGPLGDRLFYCFGCNITGDIFTAANLIEDRPLFGDGFILDNVFYLADLFHIDRSDIEISETSTLRSQIMTATRYVAEYLLNPDGKRNKPTKAVAKFIKDRNIDPDEWGYCDIGFVSDFADFKKTVSQDDPNILRIMKMAGLDDAKLFNKHNVIFIFRDEHNRPVGFAARNTLYSDENRTNKFYTQTCRGEIDVFQKSSRLFGLNKATPGTDPIYIFEGYFDACIGQLYGVNCAAVGGLYFNKDQLHLLTQLGFKNVILIFDGDQAGAEKTYKLIDELLSQPATINIRLAFMPEDMDPDEYIMSGEDITKLDRKLPFEWRLEALMQKEDEISPENMCQTMIPYVGSLQSHLQQIEYLRILSMNTGIEPRDLRQELTNFLQARERQNSSTVVDVIQQLARDVIRNPSEAEILLSRTVDTVQAIRDSSMDASVSIDEFQRYIDDVRSQEDKADPREMPGFNYGIFENLTTSLMGRMAGRVILIGGAPNTGKTSFMCNIALEIARNNDVCVLFHTIDDNRHEIMHRMLSIIAFDMYEDVTINKMCYYKYHAHELGERQLEEHRNQAYDYFSQLSLENRLIIKDADHGRTPAYSFNMVKRIQDQTGKNVVVFVDNFHNYFHRTAVDKRSKYSDIADYVKNHSLATGCTTFGTVQYTKGSGKFFHGDNSPRGRRPTNIANPNELIAETVDLEYRADAIIHVYNENHYDMDLETSVYDDENPQHPIKAIFGKNKISSIKGASANFWFYPSAAVYMPRDQRGEQ